MPRELAGCTTGSGMHDRAMRFWLVLLIFGPFCAALADEAPPPAPPKDKNLAALEIVAKPLAAADADLEKLRLELEQAATEEAKLDIQTRIDSEKERLRQLRGNFRDILGGAEAAEYEGITQKDTTLQEQVGDLLQPILSELRNATSRPRELEALRKSLAVWQDRLRKSDAIVARIDGLLEKTKVPMLVEELQAARRLWNGRQGEASGQIGVIQSQIEERVSQEKPVWDTLSDLFSRFFASRGMNLLIAILIGAVGFFIVRRGYMLLRRYSPVHRGAKGNLTSRISDILAMIAAIFVAILAVIMVFYLRGDWLLLTLAIVVLVGIAWAGKTALPPYLDQLRTLLNLGPVREGERVIYKGLPWKVSKLGFYTLFTNPDLQGGALRVPIREVMTLISREAEIKEQWFPTEPDDWAVLADGTYGKVISQTPEQVVFLRLGGSMKTFTTADFIAQTPEKLSHGFRVTSTFGIDYAHQADCTGRIPLLLAKALTTDLVAKYGRDNVRSVQVEFENAGASSLDYAILADFDGDLAPRFNALQRRIQMICVDVCNVNGWGIPFAQITVHQAPQPAPSL